MALFIAVSHAARSMRSWREALHAPGVCPVLHRHPLAAFSLLSEADAALFTQPGFLPTFKPFKGLYAPISSHLMKTREHKTHYFCHYFLLKLC